MDEIEAGEQASIKDNEDYTPLPKDVSPSASGIPEFWLTALRNHVGLNELITDRDAGALRHLIDIQIAYLESEGKPGFKLVFVFSSNEYFGNDVLEKTYLYQKEVGYSGDFVYDRAIGTEIMWKEDKDLTKEFEIKKQRNKSVFAPSVSVRFWSSYRSACRHEPHSPRKEGAADRVILQLFHPTHPACRRRHRKRRHRRG
jgi:nucleosome assembly protein 1-like 1